MERFHLSECSENSGTSTRRATDVRSFQAEMYSERESEKLLSILESV